MTSTPRSTQQLIEAFHNSLQGNIVAERKKSFHTYLNSLKNENSQTIIDVVDGITPKDFWENVLKVDIILHFQLYAHALQILKGEHRILVAKIIKNDWFIKKLLETHTARQFVDELFVVTSVSVRCRIINRLIKYNKSEKFGTELFEAYSEKYGLRAAKQLLPMCPVDVIEDIVINKKVKLATSTVRRIIDKDLKLTKHFLNRIHHRQHFELKFLARTNLPLLMKILPDCKIETSFKFGNSITHKILRHYESFVIENTKYFEIFKLKRMYSDLKTKYEELVFNIVTQENVPPRFNTLYRYLFPLAKQQQLVLYLKIFEEVAKCKLEDKPEFIDAIFLETCDNVEERQKYAELVYNVKKELCWVKYMPIEKSVTLIKEKIALAPKPHLRQDMVKALVETCQINSDKVALLEALKYVTKRFRNDKDNVRSSFCYALLDSFKLYELGHEHWVYINELQKLFEVNNEYFYRNNNLIQEQIIFKLKKGESIKELFKKLQSLLYVEYSYRSEAGVEKEFILQGLAYWNDEVENEENHKLQAYLHILEALKSYNTRNKDNCINITDTLPLKWMLDRLIDTNEWYSFNRNIFYYYIFEQTPSEDRNRAIHQFFRNSHEDVDILQHFLKKEPTALIENLDAFLECNAILEIIDFKKLLKFYRRLTHLNLNEKTIEHYKGCLEIRDKELKIKSMKALSVCMEEEDYLNLVKRYYPDEAHVDVESDESSELYHIRKVICENLLKLNTPSTALYSLLPFCVGDYLKFTLESLYNLFFYSPQHKLPNAIAQLKTKAVSVRKHAVFLSLVTLDRKFNLDFLREFAEKETNSSVIAHVLRSTFKYFSNNLDQEFFELYKFLLKKVDKNDESTFNFVTKECTLPEVFVAEYVEFVWNVIEEYGREGSDFEKTKFELLQHLKEPDYMLLTDVFLDRIVKENFLAAKNQTCMTNVVLMYLFYCNSVEKQNHRLQLTFEIIRTFKETNINDKQKMHKFCANFIEEFSNFALDYKNVSIELITEFKKYFAEIMGPLEYFNEHLTLDLLELHVQSLFSENYITNLSEKVVIFVNDLAVKYEIGGVMYCKDEIAQFIKKRLRKQDQRVFKNTLYLFLELLYISSDTLAIVVIVIALLERLDDNVSITVETKDRYECLIQKLKNRNEPVAKLLLNAFLRNCS